MTRYLNLRIRLGEHLFAASFVSDSLMETLYALAAEGYIDDTEDDGWVYSDEVQP